MVDIVNARQSLRETFEHEAQWRLQKAAEYPEDERNLIAAQRYDRLANTVADVPDDLLVAYAELFESESEVELDQELLKRVFYADTFVSASDFVRSFISRATLGLEPL